MGWWRKKKPQPNFERGAMLLEDLIGCCDGKSNPIKFFSADQIRESTDNFSESNHVFELSNGYYNWYSGKNENHLMLLIRKTVDKFYAYIDRNFCRDVAISSMVSGHKNSMKLIGCCLEFESPVMVYNGVKKHYKLEIREEPWKRRIKIAEDIDIALAYLHNVFPRPFVYRIMSLEKILLDEDGVAKLSDFAFCVSIPKGETFVKVDKVEGKRCYMDYEYVRNGVVSEETDVFAIGMLMQTLLTGKKVLSEGDGDGDGNGDTVGDGDDDSMYVIPNWQSKFMKERSKMDEIADPMMGEISEEKLYQMKALQALSQRCIRLRGKVPTMVEVAKELKKIQRSRLFFSFSLGDSGLKMQSEFAEYIS
ncbi:Inactive serine/threonine-protein kinase ZRK12 [Cardamine amara subsp. amara]|uniref:Inactive serine/threonine-protein kinase ZRK12 n=1 Tax=Cardamine amara subsp. amara TaxID=228776 RepID=A0ABD1BL77_CARAN